MKEKGTAFIEPSTYKKIHMPKNTWAGIVIAGFSFVFGFAMVWHIWWLVALSFLGMFASYIAYTFVRSKDYYVPVEQVQEIESAHYQSLRDSGVDVKAENRMTA